MTQLHRTQLHTALPLHLSPAVMQTAALKNLGLNIRRAKIKKTEDEKIVTNKFYITDHHTSEKVLRSSRLEEIRATIFENLLLYHPEAQDDMGWGVKARKPSTADPLQPLGPRRRCDTAFGPLICQHTAVLSLQSLCTSSDPVVSICHV